MPIALLIIGVVILVTSFKGTAGSFGARLKNDLTGPNNFTVWLFAIAVIGAFSYIPGFKPVANMFFALLIVVILLAGQKNNGRGGFFVQLQAALNKTTAPTTHNYSALEQGQS